MSRPKSSEDEQVVAAARNVFRAHGYGASTRRIAAEVGLSQPALIQRFGSKQGLFLAAMMPEPLDVEWIVNGAPGDGPSESGEALIGIAERLFEQIQQRLPLVLLLEQNPEIDARVIEDAHSRIGVPDLIDALCTKIESLASSNAPDGSDRARQTVEALLLAAHGATLMALAGAPPKAVKTHLTGFCRLIQFGKEEGTSS